MKLELIMVILITAVCFGASIAFYGRWMHSEVVDFPIMGAAVLCMLWTVSTAWVMLGVFRE